jgi:hypothetical protein
MIDGEKKSVGDAGKSRRIIFAIDCEPSGFLWMRLGRTAEEVENALSICGSDDPKFLLSYVRKRIERLRGENG